MRKLVMTLVLLLAVTIVEAKRNPIEQFFADCKTDYNLKQAKLGRFMFWLLSKSSNLAETEKVAISSIKQIRVFYYEDESNKCDKKNFIKTLRTQLQKTNFERLLEVRGSDSEIYWLTDKKYGYLLVVDTEDDLGFIYIKMKGNAWQNIVSSEFYSQISKNHKL